ncbi:hypothetical protein DFH09DRAFT_1368709, partial [Mycena vulgaris]
MDAIHRHHDELFYATFPDARPGPHTARAEAEHARIFAPPDLVGALTVPSPCSPVSVTATAPHGAAPPLDYGVVGREYAYPDPANSYAYFGPQRYWALPPPPPPTTQRPTLHADMSIARAVDPPLSSVSTTSSSPFFPSPPPSASSLRTRFSSDSVLSLSPGGPDTDTPPPSATSTRRSPSDSPAPAPAAKRPAKKRREADRDRDRERERERDAHKKPPLACLFCRGRKIACGPPVGPAGLAGCNQCQRRSLKCEYPAESRRGMRKKKPVPPEEAAGEASSSTAGAGVGVKEEGGGEDDAMTGDGFPTDGVGGPALASSSSASLLGSTSTSPSASTSTSTSKSTPPPLSISISVSALDGKGPGVGLRREMGGVPPDDKLSAMGIDAAPLLAGGVGVG